MLDVPLGRVAACPRSRSGGPGIVSSTAVIWFSVSVPVLSELIAEVEPSVSVERSRFTIAFARARICVPSERIVVTTAGRPVGIAEMANAIAAVKTVLKLSPRDRLRIIEIATATPAISRIWLVSFGELPRQRRLGRRPRACSMPGDVADLGLHPGRGDDERARCRGSCSCS